MDTNKIQVVDDNGNELEFDVLFTFDSEETNKKYVLYYDATDETPQVYSSIYDDDGNLFPIENPTEWEMIEEVFNSFVSQDEDEDDEEATEGGCCQGNDCDCHGEGEDHECGCQKNEG